MYWGGWGHANTANTSILKQNQVFTRMYLGRVDTSNTNIFKQNQTANTCILKQHQILTRMYWGGWGQQIQAFLSKFKFLQECIGEGGAM